MKKGEERKGENELREEKRREKFENDIKFEKGDWER